MFSFSRLLNKNKKKLDASVPVPLESTCVWLEQNLKFALIADALKIIQIEPAGKGYTLKLLINKDFEATILKTYKGVTLKYSGDWHIIKDLSLSALKLLINNVVEAAYFACENKENKSSVSDMLKVTNLYVYIYQELGLTCRYQFREIPEIEKSAPVATLVSPSAVPSTQPAQMTPGICSYTTELGLFPTSSKESSSGSYMSSSSEISTSTSTASSLIRAKPSSATYLSSPGHHVYGPLFSNTHASPASRDSVNSELSPAPHPRCE